VLSKTLMGSVALFAMWTATLLILATAAKEGMAWWRRRRSLSALDRDVEGVGLVAGRVVGPEPLARHSVLQAGRWGAVAEGAPRVILFHDRSYQSEIFGGWVERLDGGGRLRVAPEVRSGEVWAVGLEHVADPDLGFAEAYERSRQTRGFERTLRADLTAGRPVWLSGRARLADGNWVLEAPEGGTLLVSTVDPRALGTRKVLLDLLAIAGILTVAVAGTLLAVWPPRFGPRSIAGATLCLAFFLLVQPVGTWLRDALLSPARRVWRGVMVEAPVPVAATTAPPAKVH
jgi:hypothetical protein